MKTKTNSGVNAMLDEALALAADPRVVKSESGRVVSNFLLRLVETLAHGEPRSALPAKHHHPEDLPGYGDNHLHRPAAYVDPIGDLRVELRRHVDGGATRAQAWDRVPEVLMMAASKEFSTTRAARKRSVDGFPEFVWSGLDREAA
jgi:hypothetical protein